MSSIPHSQDTVSVHVFEWLDAMIQDLKCVGIKKSMMSGESHCLKAFLLLIITEWHLWNLLC